MGNVMFFASKASEKVQSPKVEWAGINCRAKAKCIKFAENEDFLSIFVYTDNLSDCAIIPFNSDWKFQEGIVAFHLAKKPYTINQKKGDNWEKVEHQPSLVEKFIISEIDKLDKSVAYSGLISFEDNSSIPLLLGIPDDDGKVQVIDENTRKFVVSNIINLSPLEANTDAYNLVPDNEVVGKVKSTSNFKSSGQSELQKLTDRLNFVRQQIQVEGIDYEITSLLSLTMTRINSSNLSEVDKMVLLEFSSLLGLFF